MSQATVCDIKEPLNPIKVYQIAREKIHAARTKQERIDALVEFASAHGLFSDRPELYKHARCQQ